MTDQHFPAPGQVPGPPPPPTQPLPVAPPVYEQPTYQQPTYQQPAYEQPAYEIPSYGPPPIAAPPIAAPPIAAPPVAAAGKRPWNMVAGAVAVAGLAIGGTYFATKSDSKGTSSPAVAVTSTLPGTVAPSVAPASSTTLPGSTTPPSVPAPAPTGDLIDLGLGVAVPVADGFEQVDSGSGPVRMKGGGMTLEVQVRQRTPGEDAAVLAQEYANIFDGDFDAISYSTVTSVIAGEGTMRVTSFDYTTFDAASGGSIYGVVEVLVRPDGLTALIDQYADAVTEQTAQEGWLRQLAAALLAAPSTGASVPLTDVQPFILDSVHQSVYLSDQVRFTIAPGFTLAKQEGAVATLNNGVYVFEAELVRDVATIDDLVAFGQTVMGEFVPTATVDVSDDITVSNGVIRRTLQIEGTSVSGQPILGFADFYFDPATSNGVWTWNIWDAAANDTDPHGSEVIFMLKSLTIENGIS